MIQSTLPETFSVPSAHNTNTRYHPTFNGTNWTCDCQHYNTYHTDCRHILQKRLETKTKGMYAGDSYEPLLDEIRLTRQSLRIFKLMIDGEWRTLNEINEETHDPPSSISAQLRHFRKKRFGSHLVDKRRRGDDIDGLWEYRLVINEKSKMVLQ